MFTNSELLSFKNYFQVIASKYIQLSFLQVWISGDILLFDNAVISFVLQQNASLKSFHLHMNRVPLLITAFVFLVSYVLPAAIHGFKTLLEI